MHFYKWLERTYPLNGNTIHANSKFEENVADLKAEIRGMVAALAQSTSFQPAQLNFA